jgi:hypothetical protein
MSPVKTKLRRKKMNFRRKLAMIIPVVVVAALAVALIGVPAVANNQSPARPAGGEVLNSPTPIPTIISYQGYLTDLGGNPINDTLEMTFSIYNVASGGTSLWSETHTSVIVTDGQFGVLLGSINPIYVSLLTGESYLGIKVGSDPEMTPRQKIASVAYALRADKANDADTLDGMDSTNFALSTHNHDAAYVNVTGDTMTGQLVLPANGLVAGTDQLVLTDGKVGIGTTTPGSYKLNVQAGDSYGIYASSNNFAVFGQHSTSSNYGILGNAVSGVYGNHYSTGNYGFIGTSSEGVFGQNMTSGNHGQLGTENEGVYGANSASSNYGRLGTGNDGVAGYSNVDFGSGVYGHNTAAGYGVYGRNINSNNYGWLGGNDIAVYGNALGSNDIGGYFRSETGYGLIVEKGKVGIGTTSPAQTLHVNGISQFDLPSGSWAISTPGGWPGLIGYSTNGHRRELGIKDNLMYLAISNSSAAPAVTNGIVIMEDGAVGIGCYPSQKLDVNGTTRTQVLQITGGSDIAEPFDIEATDVIEAGMVLVIDSENPGKLRVSEKAYDRCVAGIVSGAGDIQPGVVMGQTGTMATGEHPVALSGRVYCWANASNGPIAPGDLLTTSDTPGHAMKVTDYNQAQGAILGKAMSYLEEGQGLVLVLVTLQ